MLYPAVFVAWLVLGLITAVLLGLVWPTRVREPKPFSIQPLEGETTAEHMRRVFGPSKQGR